jgi:putative ABC transport system permease protein
MIQKMRYKSPAIPRKILKLISLYHESHSIVEDFEETFAEILESEGSLKAKSWYWNNALKSVAGYLKLLVCWEFTMLKNHLKIAYRNFKRQKLFSFINIASLTVGFSCGILILIFIRYEFSYDKYHDDAQLIYRVVREHQGESTWYNSSEHPLAASLKQDFPEVLKATRVKKNDEVGVVEHNSKRFYEEGIYFVDQDFLEIFTFPLLSGNMSTTLEEPFSVLITQKMAVKYFGEEEPLGKVIQINEWYSEKRQNYVIKGILKNIPENSHFRFDFLVSYNSLYFLKKGGRDSVETWSYFEPKTYIKLAPFTNPMNLEGKFPAFLRKYKGEESTTEKIHLQPLTDIHLGGNLRFELEDNSDMRSIYMFSAIAFFIMLIACLNYVNLSVARSTKRAIEVGVRKVVGANKTQLVKQFLLESVAASIIALLISFILVELVWPSFNSLIGREPISNPFQSLDMVLVFIGIAVIIGFLSGSYPAFFISSFQPIQIIKRTLKLGSNSSSFFRNSLVVAQFVISIILIVCTFVIHNQLSYIRDRNLGFDKEQVITIYTLDGSLKKNPEPLKEELLRTPNILGVSASLDLPTTIRRTTSLEWIARGEECISEFYFTFVDSDYFNVYDMEIVRGRNFSEDFPTDKEKAVVINETALRNLGWENPIGRRLKSNGVEWTVIGVVKDFNFKSLRSKIEPVIFTTLNADRRLDYFSIKVSPIDIPSTIGFIRDKWERFSPEFPFQSTFLDERIERVYRAEQRLGKSFSIFTIIALMIAGMGLIGLASFISEQKRKEISLRKILGADFRSIIFLLSNVYLKCIAVAIVIAWPVGYIVMNRWLSNFAYRTSIRIEIFILSGLLVLIFALMTVSYQSIKAAIANPVDSLHYE